VTLWRSVTRLICLVRSEYPLSSNPIARVLSNLVHLADLNMAPGRSPNVLVALVVKGACSVENLSLVDRSNRPTQTESRLQSSPWSIVIEAL